MSDKITVTPSFLGEPEWLTIPWEKHPETKNGSQKLLDLSSENTIMFSGGCREFAEVYAIGGNLTPVFHKYFPILIQCIIRAVRWRWEWEENNPDAAFEKPVD